MKNFNLSTKQINKFQRLLDYIYGKRKFLAGCILLLFGLLFFTSCESESPVGGQEPNAEETRQNPPAAISITDTRQRAELSRIPFEYDDHPAVLNAYFAKEENQQYVKIDKAEIGDDVYVIIDTLNMPGNNIEIRLHDNNNILTGNISFRQYADAKKDIHDKEVFGELMAVNDGVFSAKVNFIHTQKDGEEAIEEDYRFAIFKLKLDSDDRSKTKSWRKDIYNNEKQQLDLFIIVNAGKVFNEKNVIYCGSNLPDEEKRKTDPDNNVFLDQEGKYLNVGYRPCLCCRNFTEEEFTNIIKGLRDGTQENNVSISTYHGYSLWASSDGIPDEDKTMERFCQVINTSFENHHINACLRKIHFLAQMYIETQYFTRTKENGVNLVYDPYRGRGFLQLTGFQTRSGNWIAGESDSRTKNKTGYLGYKEHSGVDVVEEPDLISNSLDLSADSGGWFWENGKLWEDGNKININLIADTDDITQVTKMTQGGRDRLIERTAARDKLKELFYFDDCEKGCINS